MKEYKGSIIFTLCIIALLVVTILGANFEHKQDEKRYNQGICTLCGGQYIFSSSSHVKNSSDLYYYTCDSFYFFGCLWILYFF